MLTLPPRHEWGSCSIFSCKVSREVEWPSNQFCVCCHQRSSRLFSPWRGNVGKLHKHLGVVVSKVKSPKRGKRLKAESSSCLFTASVCTRYNPSVLKVRFIILISKYVGLKSSWSTYCTYFLAILELFKIAATVIFLLILDDVGGPYLLTQ